MFLRTSIIAIALLGSALAVAQTSSLVPTYPTYGALKQSGYANDIFLKQVTLTVSRIDFGPPTPLRTMYQRCIQTQATGDCQQFLQTLETAFKAKPSFYGVLADEWQNWTGPKIRETQFNLYFMRVLLVQPTDSQEMRYRTGCSIENDDFNCSRWFNILKARFVVEGQKTTANPWVR
jgi:hypothetical protein